MRKYKLNYDTVLIFAWSNEITPILKQLNGHIVKIKTWRDEHTKEEFPDDEYAIKAQFTIIDPEKINRLELNRVEKIENE